MEIWYWLEGFWHDYGPPIMFGAVVVGVLVLMLYAVHQDAVEWKEFAAEHSCKVVGRVSGSTGTGFGTTVGANGQIGFGPTIVSVPGKTGYQCDDGVTYWR